MIVGNSSWGYRDLDVRIVNHVRRATQEIVQQRFIHLLQLFWNTKILKHETSIRQYFTKVSAHCLANAGLIQLQL